MSETVKGIKSGIKEGIDKVKDSDACQKTGDALNKAGAKTAEACHTAADKVSDACSGAKVR